MKKAKRDDGLISIDCSRLTPAERIELGFQVSMDAWELKTGKRAPGKMARHIVRKHRVGDSST